MQKSRNPLGGLALIAALAGLGASVHVGNLPSPPPGTFANEGTQSPSNADRGTPQRSATLNASDRAMLGSGWRGNRGPQRWPGRGWSVAHDRRMARKARNRG